MPQVILVSVMLAYSKKESRAKNSLAESWVFQFSSIQGRPYYLPIIAMIGDYFKNQFKLSFKMKFPN